MNKRRMYLCAAAVMFCLSACGNEDAGRNKDAGREEETKMQSSLGEASVQQQPDGNQPETPADEDPDTKVSDDPDVDVDLTQLSSTMVYSEVYQMMMMPEEYAGKKVRMGGEVVIYPDEATGKTYYAVIIKDATACCAQGMEFELKEEYEYPEAGEALTVTGVFQTYEEDGLLYCHLADAQIEE